MAGNERLGLTAKQIAEEFVSSSSNKRAVGAVKLILERGSVTTREMRDMGYDHPPRALMDAKDAGVPIRKENDKASDGKLMARYFLDDSRTDSMGFTGRAPIPKSIKTALLIERGPHDNITGALTSINKLTIDHRVPYQVGGDEGLSERNLGTFQLLDLSSQRKKSWACEHCENFTRIRKPATCLTCFWASPENYEHVALEPTRRTDIIWTGSDVKIHDDLKDESARSNQSIADLLKQLARRSRK